MVKMIFSDMDGTLLNSKKLPSRQDIATIAALEKKGIPFCITTGRSWFMTKGYVKMLGLRHLTIAANGALVMDPEGRILFRKPMDSEIAYKIARRLADEGKFFRVYTADKIYTYPHAEGFEMLEEYNAIVEPSERAQVSRLPSPELIKEMEVFKILGHDVLPHEGDSFRAQFGELPLNLLTTEGCMLDVTSKDINKGTGVAEVCRIYGVDIEDVAAMGDDNNDLMMLRSAGVSAAPKSAKPEALKVAKHILPSNNDSPLTYLVEEVLGL